MTTFNLVAELERAKTIKGILKGAGYNCEIVGGALRVLALGGSTQDVDIAVIVEGGWEYHALVADMRILLRPFAPCIQHSHDLSGYSSNDGFMGDLRLGNINVIAYSKDTYPNIDALIGKFDLNINQWYIDSDGNLENDYWCPNRQQVKINKYRDSCHRIGRLDERIARFKQDLPHLDWSKLND